VLGIEPSNQARKFSRHLPNKHQKQIAEKIAALRVDPFLPDTIQMKGAFSEFRRASVGEYRIIYHVSGNSLFIDVIGKRNDDEVYKLIKFKL